MRTITCAVFCGEVSVAVLDVVALDVVALDVVALDVVALDVVALDVVALDVVGDELVFPRDNTVPVDVVGEVTGDFPHAAITKLAAARNVVATHRCAKLLLRITSSGSFQITRKKAYLSRGGRINRTLFCRTP